LTWKPTPGATEAVHTDMDERLEGKLLHTNHMPVRRRSLFSFEQLRYQANLRRPRRSWRRTLRPFALTDTFKERPRFLSLSSVENTGL
jgi:hypothetical protein